MRGSSPPGHPRRRYRLATRAHDDALLPPETWVEANPATEGSWWTPWRAWLAARSGAPAAPPAMGNALANRPAHMFSRGDKMTGTLTNYLFHQMKIGDRASLVRHVGPKDIELFAAVSGDASPRASGCRFRRPWAVWPCRGARHVDCGADFGGAGHPPAGAGDDLSRPADPL